MQKYNSRSSYRNVDIISGLTLKRLSAKISIGQYILPNKIKAKALPVVIKYYNSNSCAKEEMTA
jgi:hypothetical protein